MGAMLYAAVYGLLNTTGFVIAVKLLSVALAVVFCLYFFSKEGRDERGRAIIGTASFFAALSLVVTLNLMGLFTYTVMSDIRIFTSALCLVLLVFEVVELAAIAILRVLR